MSRGGLTGESEEETLNSEIKVALSKVHQFEYLLTATQLLNMNGLDKTQFLSMISRIQSSCYYLLKA